MLPFRGHSLVILTNEDESPARYVLALSVLDALLGLQPATPSWEQRYVQSLVAERKAAAKANADLRAKIRATPPAGRTPRLPLDAYSGSYFHPAYTAGCNATVDKHPSSPGLLRLCGAATLWAKSNTEPSTPACAPLLHVYYETFALGASEVAQVSTSTLMLTFVSGADGRVGRFDAPVEPKVASTHFSRIADVA